MSSKSEELVNLLDSEDINICPRIVAILTELRSGIELESADYRHIIYNPMEFARCNLRSQQSLYGISTRTFAHLNNKNYMNDYSGYFSCIEAIPDLTVSYEILLLMLWSFEQSLNSPQLTAFIDQIPSTLGENSKWNGNVILYLVMNACLNLLSSQREAYKPMLRKLAARLTEKEAVMFSIVLAASISYRVSGDFSRDKKDNLPARYHNNLISILDDVCKTTLLKYDNFVDSAFSELFDDPIDISSLDISSGNQRATHKSGNKDGMAIVVANILGIHLEPTTCIKHSISAILCHSVVQVWENRCFKTISQLIAEIVASQDESLEIWQEIRFGCRGMIYKSLYEFTPNSSYELENQFNIYMGMCVCLISDFINKKRKKAALEIWKSAWNDCITALYSQILPQHPFYMVQYLFIYAARHFTGEPDGVDCGLKLIKMLPEVQLPNAVSLDSRKQCLKAFKANLDDAAELRLKKSDPDLLECLS